MVSNIKFINRYKKRLTKNSIKKAINHFFTNFKSYIFKLYKCNQKQITIALFTKKDPDCYKFSDRCVKQITYIALIKTEKSKIT